MIGKTLAHYEITAAIGKGGMGEVYQATDGKLGRNVAIKVLPEEFAQDSDRVARFEREAKLLASLNHPNIAAIYGLEESEGTRFLVLELVEGDTLADRLQRGPVPVQESLELALQIAEALEAAYEKGVIHRDLKPANIKVTSEGKVKVLDFGLAKAYAGTALGDETVLETLAEDSESGRGVLLGTPAYMSPEQARRQPADHRSDVWAFGCVLYEVLTGKTLFKGNTLSDTIAAILEREPDFGAMPDDLDPALRRLLERCLERIPKRRWQAIGDVRIAMELAAEAERDPLPVKVDTRGWERVAWVTATSGLLIAVLALLVTGVGDSDREPEAVRFVVPLPPGAGGEEFALARDGQRMAFIGPDSDGERVIWLRAFESEHSEALPGTEGAASVYWSPDNRLLGFSTDQGRVKKLDLSGGSPQTLYDGRSFNGTWNNDGTILLAGLNRLPEDGGPLTPVAVQDGFSPETPRGFPFFLPDGNHFLYSVYPDRDPGAVHVASLESGRASFLLDANSGAQYADGHILFLRGGTLMAQRFDPATLALDDQPQTIGRLVVSGSVLGEVSVPFSVSENGMLAFRPGPGVDGQLVWFDRQGKELGTAHQPESGEFVNPALSPDGRRVAVNRRDPASGNVDIWLIDVERNTTTRFTSNPSYDMDPVWSPQGDRIVFATDRNDRFDLWVKDVVSGNEELVFEGAVDTEWIRPTDWSGDGRFILFEDSPADSGDVWVLPVLGDQAPWRLLDSDSYEYGAVFSPDGNWVAYASAETGTMEIYVTSFPAGENTRRVSSEGGFHPRWRNDGEELFFGGEDRRVMAVRVELDSGDLRVGPPERVFEPQITGLVDSRNHYSVTLEGDRFLLRRPHPNPKPVSVVVNWTGELNRK